MQGPAGDAKREEEGRERKKRKSDSRNPTASAPEHALWLAVPPRRTHQKHSLIHICCVLLVRIQTSLRLLVLFNLFILSARNARGIFSSPRPPLFPLQLLHAAAGPRAFAFSTDSAHVETWTLFVSHYCQMKVEDPFCPFSSPKLRIIAGRTSLHKSTFSLQGGELHHLLLKFRFPFHFISAISSSFYPNLRNL